MSHHTISHHVILHYITQELHEARRFSVTLQLDCTKQLMNLLKISKWQSE